MQPARRTQLETHSCAVVATHTDRHIDRQSDTHTHTRTHTHTHTHMHTHTHAHTRTHTHTHTRTHARTHTHTQTHAPTQTHTHKHIHTHTRTYDVALKDQGIPAVICACAIVWTCDMTHSYVTSLIYTWHHACVRGHSFICLCQITPLRATSFISKRTSAVARAMRYLSCNIFGTCAVTCTCALASTRESHIHTWLRTRLQSQKQHSHHPTQCPHH